MNVRDLGMCAAVDQMLKLGSKPLGVIFERESCRYYVVDDLTNCVPSVPMCWMTQVGPLRLYQRLAPTA